MSKPFIYILKNFWSSSKTYVLLSFLNQFIKIIVPFGAAILPGLLIIELTNDARTYVLGLYVGIYAFYIFLSGIFSTFIEEKISILQYKLFILLEEKKLEHSLQLDFATLEDSSFLDKREQANKFTGETGFGSYFESMMNLIGQCLVLIGFSIGIVTLNIFIFLFLILLFIMRSWITLKIEKRIAEVSLQSEKYERANSYFGFFVTLPQFAKEVRINGLKDFFSKKSQKNRAKSLKFGKKMFHYRELLSLINLFLDILGQAVAYLYLIYQVLRNQIDVGLFTIYLASMLQMSGILTEASRILGRIREQKVYFEAFKEVIDIKSTMENDKKLPTPTTIEKIEFKKVSFKYPGTDTYVLKNVDLILKEKEKLAIVGVNGAGKSTFIKLLCRLYDPTEGQILLNGINIKQFDYSEYMKLFAPVFQDFGFFSFSVEENVAPFGMKSGKSVEDVLEEVGFGDKLLQLPNGIKTTIYKEFDTDGFVPSGGESQKLALARALYKDAPIILLDEPTAALDPKTEVFLYEKFNELIENKMSIFITHRLASTKFCDKIVVFTENEEVEKSVIQYGSHNELIKQGGEYKKLYKAQSRFYV